jgi:hypothetical protein
MAHLPTRLLGHLDSYLEDKRLHIIAAPGSGKTVLLRLPASMLHLSEKLGNQQADWIQARHSLNQGQLKKQAEAPLNL